MKICGNNTYGNNLCNPKRKTMSVNISNGINQMSGFVFGKKSMQKTMHKEENISKRYEQNRENDINVMKMNERRGS
jgi:hypothetical protein